MWSSNFRAGFCARRAVRRLLGLALIPALAAQLAGCIQPLYATLGPGGLESELRAIKIEPINNRIGHYIAQELRFAFNGSGTPTPPKYKLQVYPRERVFTPVIDTVSGRASSATLAAEVEFVLTPIAGGPPIAQGAAFGIASYDRFVQRLANVRAARDAEIRDAKVIASQIQEQIAAKFARGE